MIPSQKTHTEVLAVRKEWNTRMTICQSNYLMQLLTGNPTRGLREWPQMMSVDLMLLTIHAILCALKIREGIALGVHDITSYADPHSHYKPHEPL